MRSRDFSSHHRPEWAAHTPFAMLRWTIGRHGHGFGHRGGGRGFGGPEGFGDREDGLPRGRKFSSDDLQLLLLALLEARPGHGYELIRQLEQRSNGFYVPSPGMVYPALTYLEERDFVTVTLDGNRKQYALASLGQQYLEQNRARVDFMLAKLTAIAERMDRVRQAFAGDPASAENMVEPVWLPELIEARRNLKRALHAADGAPEAEQRRIASILERAAMEIAQRPDPAAR
ncbi:PadR family transcriptional regulator [Paraburkholderia bonniea]|uniref:PadR family transcriptional regulator n=1 Tax=Paraburkholderia bonniea TaxID=2152891 RepID=UPI001290E758|nr:PadR family transcriptional regulator [Paraburkholderia bonniea]WJF90261.1 PadR family transcriptional regulator [Paraburkholderia bonniea]WJF93576.1 PadR family transcriptional regulator [Paraburkholderia bonniea]